MSVELEWEIEDVETPLPASAPPPARRRRRGCVRWIRLALIVALLGVAAVGYLRFKVHERRTELEQELQVAVELELRALIDGDRDLFLGRQDPKNPRWQRLQEQSFDRYNRPLTEAPWSDPPPVARYSGEIPVVKVLDDRGWAQVQVQDGERERQELWFYYWTKEEGWRHRSFDRDWLGEERTTITLHFQFTYWEREAPIVRGLAREMERWYDLLAPLFDIEPQAGHLMQVHFLYRDPGSFSYWEPRWQGSSSEFQVLTPHQGRFMAQDEPTPELRGQLAAALAEALIARQSGAAPQTRQGFRNNALQRELRDWAVAQLIRQSDQPIAWDHLPTPLLDALVSSAGIDVVPRLAANLQISPVLDRVITRAGAQPLDPATRFGFLIAAAQRAFHELDLVDTRLMLDPDADERWRSHLIDLVQSRRESVRAGLNFPAPQALQVRSVTLTNGTAWVEAQSHQDEGSPTLQTLFFRQVADGWLLTQPDPLYFGARRELRTENLTFRYFEREAPWFESTLPAELQRTVSQVSTELGIPTAGLVITIETGLELGIIGMRSQDGSALILTSPLLVGWSPDQIENKKIELSLPLIGALFEHGTLDGFFDAAHNTYVYSGAFIWELTRLFAGQIDWEFWLGRELRPIPALSLSQVWTLSEADLEGDSFNQILSSYYWMVSFLAERYGPEVVARLLNNLPKTDDLDEWLRLSTGVGLDEIQPAWEAWVLSTNSEP